MREGGIFVASRREKPYIEPSRNEEREFQRRTAAFVNFVLWVCRSMHIFGVVVWLGGLMFQNAIAQPVVNFESAEAKDAMRKVNRRFTGFIWMCVWTVGVTGFIMMLLSPQFYWFRYDNTWSVLLGFKELLFLLMIFYAFGHARMLSLCESGSPDGGSDEQVRISFARANQFRKISIFLGITAMLLATAMA